MISFGIGINIKGKSLTRLSHDLRIEMTHIRNDSLEVIRKQLMHEAPRKSKGNRWSENKIYNYLSGSTNCIRRRGRYDGYVILDERKLPHLKYVVHRCPKSGNWIYPDFEKGHKALKICHPKQPAGVKCGVLAARVKYHKANTFIERAYVRSGKPLHYKTRRHIERALYKK